MIVGGPRAREHGSRAPDEVQRAATGLQFEIRGGVYPPGSLLPGSANTFARAFGVSTGTMRAALNMLRVRGYLRHDILDGWYVADELPPEPAAPGTEETARSGP